MNSFPKHLVVANFKMNFSTKAELALWLSSFQKEKLKLKNSLTQLILCPPDIFLENFIRNIKSKKVSFGAQNCFWMEKGAFTGEVSPLSLKWLGVDYVILGHSERRSYLGETDQTVNRKIMTCLKRGLRPILCVGENSAQKKDDLLLEVVTKQLENCLDQVSKGNIERIIFCYEPVWAISANQPSHLPSSNEIMGAKLLIRKFLAEKYGRNVAERVKIIYGGSVDSRNIKQVCLDPAMDGVLVGSASLVSHELVKICQQLG